MILRHVMQRRREQDALGTEMDGQQEVTGTMFQDKHYTNKKGIRSLRKMVEYLDQRHSNYSIVGLTVHFLMECVSFGLYVWIAQISYPTTLSDFKWNYPVFIVQFVLNVIFFCEWVAIFFFEQHKLAYMFSWLSGVNLLTSVPMIVLGIGGFVHPSWRHGWVPMYLRVWWIKDCLYLLYDYPIFADNIPFVYQSVVRDFTKLFALLATAVMTLHIIDNCRGIVVDVYTYLYITVVGFATIGFGDYTPKSTVARLFMTGFIITGICFFMPLFVTLARLSQLSQFHTSYRRWRLFGRHKCRHVIICGAFSDTAVDLLLRNFYAGWRKYLSTTVVLMSPVENSAEVQLIANLPWFKTRVKLLVGDPANPVDLRRADARHADAIFLFANARSTAYHNDFTLISQAAAVALYDPELPQHVMLRRSHNVKHVAPYASNIFEIERTMHQLLGLSMVLPGVIPVVINLTRTYEPSPMDVTVSRHWVEQYEYSLRNDIYTLSVPDSLRGREFRPLARAFFDVDVVLIGVLGADHQVLLNPAEVVPNARKLVLIARTLSVASHALADISRNYERRFGEEMLVAPDPDEYFARKRRANEDQQQQHQHSHSDLDGFTEGKGSAASLSPRDAAGAAAASPASAHGPLLRRCSFEATHGDLSVFRDDSSTDTADHHPHHGGGGAATAVVPQHRPRLVEVQNAFDMENHFLVIDLASAKNKDPTSRYAQEAANLAVAHDIYQVVSPVRQAYPQNDVVLITCDLTFAPYFESYAEPQHQGRHDARANNTSGVGGIGSAASASDYNPIKYIVGSGLDTAVLRRCHLEKCAGCVIFFTGDISRVGSTSAMSMLVVLSISEILHRTPTFPIVVELEGLVNLPLFPPYAEDPRLRSKAEVDFVFEPNFLIGNALSRQMLFPLMQRTYFMEDFIDIVDVLISGHAPGVPALARMPLSMCEVELDTYDDVISFFLKIGFLPIALHRRIHDIQNPSISGQRFVLTNPPRALPVVQDVDAVFYITPAPF